MKQILPVPVVMIVAIQMLTMVLIPGFQQSYAQTLTQKLTKAFAQFEQDPQLKYAISSLYVTEPAGGKVIFAGNATTGLAPASTQKLITSAASLDVLGKDFRFTTYFALEENTLYIFPSGDPTLGSERWENTKAAALFERIITWLTAQNAKIDTLVIIKDNRASQDIPDGWVWQDIGNYYGAGAAPLNWRENQFGLLLQSGKQVGDPVRIMGTDPQLYEYQLASEVYSAAKGSGDNAYIYFPLTGKTGSVKGTIPVNETAFVISGALPSGAQQFAGELSGKLITTGLSDALIVRESTKERSFREFKNIRAEKSPSLDSIVYWFNKKSINLYGEALLKAIGLKEAAYASTDTGVSRIRRFWKQKGLDENEINIVDGSGLSPLNRVTTHSEVQVLAYAQKQPWFPVLLNSLPVYNGIKMKSGTIKDVKGFTGYHTSREGKTYLFSFLVNNYNGSSASLIRKMYRVLDLLK